MDKTGMKSALRDSILVTDPGEERARLENRLIELRRELGALGPDGDSLVRARLELGVAEALLGLGRLADAWEAARGAFSVFADREQWESAVESCNVMFESDQPMSLAALGNGVWLAVTFPVPPKLTVNMLHHIVDETPDHSDGAAVAALMAHYIVDLRAADKEREDLQFLTSQVIAQVAKRHRGIEDEEGIKIWIEVLQLNDVPELLSRMAQILDAIVGDQWWIDRDALRESIPED